MSYIYISTILSTMEVTVSLIFILLVNLFFRKEFERNYNKIFTVAVWTLVLNTIIIRIINQSSRFIELELVINNIVLIINLHLIIYGILKFYKKKRHMSLLYGSIFIIIFYITDYIFMLAPVLFNIIINVYIGLLYMSVGILLGVYIKKKYTIDYLIIYAIILCGLNRCGFIALNDSVIYMTPNYFIGISLRIIAIICVLIKCIYFIISDLSAKENEYRVEKERMNFIIENQTDVIFEINKEGIFTFVNPACSKVLGYNKDNIIGKNFCDFFNIQQFEDILRNHNPQNTSIEVVWKKNDLTESHLNIKLTRILSIDKTFIGAVGIINDNTQQKFELQILSNSKEFYQGIYSNNYLAMLLIDYDTKCIIDANTAACSFYGYCHEDIVGLSMTQINTLPPEKTREKMREALERGQLHFLAQHRIAGGELKDVEVFSGPIKIGEKIILYSIIHDKSDEMKVKKALEYSRSKFNQLFDNANDAIFINKVENGRFSRFIEVNAMASSMFGYSREELLLLSPYDLDGDNDSLYSLIEEINLLIHTKNLITERTVITKQGIKIPSEISFHLSIIDNEELLIITVRDISERKASMKEMKKLSEALEQSASVVVITDAKGNIRYVNRKFTEVTEYDKKEVIGKNVRMLKSGIHNDDYYKKLWQEIVSGKEWRGEFCNRKKSGNTYWASASISGIKDEFGIIEHFVCIQEDITYKKSIEMKLEEKNNELSCAIGELKKTQMQMVQQEKLAGIGQLAAGVAHEINNPLGFVISNHETLRKYVNRLKEALETYKRFKCDVPCRDMESMLRKNMYIDEMEKKLNINFVVSDLEELFNDSSEGLERVNEIVKSLRSFSRIDQIDEFGEYDINQGIETTLIMARNEIKYCAEVQKKLENTHVINASGGQINQVLLNILINAVYAIKEKRDGTKGIIKITTYNDGDFVYCTIEDNGKGIPREKISDIFNPFYTTKPVGEGTGLGLSIAYDIIVNKHNGNITVESEPQVSTKFIIKLPINNDCSINSDK